MPKVVGMVSVNTTIFVTDKTMLEKEVLDASKLLLRLVDKPLICKAFMREGLKGGNIGIKAAFKRPRVSYLCGRYVEKCD